MTSIRSRRWLAAVLAAPVVAFGAAHSTVHVTGEDGIDVSESIATDDAGYNYQFFSVDVAPGQTVTRTFHYTVSVADDGLPAMRTEQNVCTPDYLSDCGPAATGFEQAYALIEIGRDRRAVDGDNAFLNDNNLLMTFQSVTGDPRTYTGTLVYTATDESPFIPQRADLQVMLFALADVSAVPEPAGGTLALLGLAPVLALARRRAREAAFTRCGPAPSAAR